MNPLTLVELLRDILTIATAIMDVLVTRDTKSAKELLGDIPATEIARNAEKIRAAKKFGKL